jgi:hypothetical protein
VFATPRRLNKNKNGFIGLKPLLNQSSWSLTSSSSRASSCLVIFDTRGKDRRIWEPYVLNAYGSHMHGSWNKCVNHVCCTFVFGGDTKAKTKVQQRSLTPLFYHLRICEPYAFNAYGFHMRQSLPPVWSWRVYLYDFTAGATECVDVATAGGSTTFTNPSFSRIVSLRERDAIAVGLFLLSECAALGETGQLIYYCEY